jgi:hypothetical protein
MGVLGESDWACDASRCPPLASAAHGMLTSMYVCVCVYVLMCLSVCLSLSLSLCEPAYLEEEGVGGDGAGGDAGGKGGGQVSTRRIQCGHVRLLRMQLHYHHH